MKDIEKPCPFCGRRITFMDVATATEREAGLIYLRGRCVPCDARIEAAGVGDEGAVADLDRILAKRIGTSPTDWRIVPAVKGHRR